MTSETKQAKQMVKNYPKMALKGEPIVLDAEWKKGYVAYVCLKLVNAKFMNQVSILSQQISEEFDANFNKGIPMQLVGQNAVYAKIICNLRNAFTASANYLTNTLGCIDKLITPESSVMEKELYADYVAGKAILLKSAEEERKLVNEINASFAACFPNDVQALKNIDQEVVAGLHRQADFQAIFDRINKSLGTEIRV